MAEFPVAFIFFVEDLECSQALQFCHDHLYDIYDFYQHGVNVIGYMTFNGFENCRNWCSNNNFKIVAFQISYMHI